MTKAKLYILEGADGVGKTTLCKTIVHHLKSLGLDACSVSSPGRDPGSLGHQVYQIHHDCMDHGGQSIHPASLQLLHIAAHIDLIERHIRPALERGTFVVLDRCWWSTMAYGAAAGVPTQMLEAMIQLEEMYWRDTKPACVFLVSRPNKKSTSVFKKRVLQEYHKLALSEADKYPVRVIENNQDLGHTRHQILESDALTGLVHISQEVDTASATIGVPFQSSRGLNIISKLSPAVPSLIYDTYWKFAHERQAIFFKRFEECPPPWTLDEILGKYKFTNAYRVSDRTSQYLIRNVIYAEPYDPVDEVFRTLLFKFFNKIDTWQLLSGKLGKITHRDYNFKVYDQILTTAIESGVRIYSAAYIMPSGGRGISSDRKHRMHLRLLERMLSDALPQRLSSIKTMKQAFELLRSYPTIGDFLAYQYVIDLNYGRTLNFSEMEFVTPGPGARDGIRKCFTSFGGLSEADIIRLMTDVQEEEFDRLGLNFKKLWGRPLQLIDCQNIFCEMDKYSRVKHPEMRGVTGRTRIKQQYTMTDTPLEYWYPPKWQINDNITRRRSDVPVV